ncbi:MAG: lipid IV(A) 3-deoxy-D-manno-octulosonic acid transferase [Woeseiaceae bacterium]|nr:lipid IV(A) 3-deoxy-D-manno-octulosonic acid transferase [Woeseiaceae bacterium]
MRVFYNLLIYLLQIPAMAYWFVRALANRSYRDRVGQRFGIGYPQLEKCIWIHAVSVGEVQAAVPLVRAIQKRFPDHHTLITTVTPTGAARVVANFGDSVTHCYIPFEMPLAVDRFFASVNPELALIMETEIWPNLYQGCGIRDIPLVLVSARISPKSVDKYRKLLPLFRETLSHGIIIAAQSEADAERFRSLGASPVRTWVTGNIKFDIELPPELADRGKEFRQSYFGERPVWVAASTHDQEEQQVLAAHRALLERFPDLLLVLVPRHPERFPVVADLIDKRGFDRVSRTEERPCDPGTSVFFGDTMGEVPMFYAASDLAFVGGSLVPIGGHNLLEPAALGLPLVSGPHVYNAQEISDLFIGLGACHIVEDAAGLAAAVTELLEDPAAAAEQGGRGRDIVQQNRGALARLLKLLEPLLEVRRDS